MSFSIAPFPKHQFFDDSGNPLSNGTLQTFLAGTSTPTATFSDISGTPNANPLTLDAAGRVVGLFLQYGISYKFLLKNSAGATVWTFDNISALSTSVDNSDVNPAVAGENLTAGQPVYMSIGEGGKNAGQWYKADTSSTYSSTNALYVGMVLQNILQGASGPVRLVGLVTGLSALTIGAQYYLGAAGAITLTPGVNARLIGVANSATSLVLGITQLVDPSIAGGRLTLSTGVPVTTGDVTAATNIFYTAYLSNEIALYDGVIWKLTYLAELSIALPAVASQIYDVFLYNNSGTPTLELLAWTNDTTRATALVLQNGVLCKTGALTRRYLGSVRTTTVAGQTEDSRTARYVWNYNNRVGRELRRLETTASWNYTTATIRQANAATANQVDFITGVVEEPFAISLKALVSNNTGGLVHASVGLGVDSTTTFLAPALAQADFFANLLTPLTFSLTLPTLLGRHVYSWNEYSAAVGVTTWYGVDPTFGGNYYGITGWIKG